ncbi:hypothetical protein H6P81_010874 [Aristolochia fimbriata]|uniref:RNA helicase n=1 Tax=Aristolochia fimbriata TaxID=158543 RepID=A0AAV7ER58_ARIFI|nr:hypothetical protein H6P81_010874 [Aristolochia fimbriata]
MANLLSAPLPPSAFLQGNPNATSFSSLRCSFSPISIFVSRKGKVCLYRKPISASAAVEFKVPVRTNGFDASDHLDISKLGISEEIVSALSRRGITELFPIQRAVLEPAMEGRDMIGRAITGSGKTLAFGIPIIDKILQHRSPQRRKRVPSALVLAPTRELARQVEKEFKETAPNLSSACLYGGIPINNQSRMLGFGIDIAVGTPGRIIDLVERGVLDLSEVKFAVLDEADQMLAIGFQEDVECILSYLPAKKQCMLFSATMPAWVNELSRKYLRDPLVIDLVGETDQKLADGISLFSVSSAASGKQNSLMTLISKYGQGGKSIVFTKTKKDAELLSQSVGSILRSRALHGNMPQFKRDKTLTDFRNGRFNVLIATDVAARGLDIPNVDLVVHFEIPNTSEIFVHRSGRTGRAGKKGTAVLMFTESQRRAVRYIERDLGCKFEELPKITNTGGNKPRNMDLEEKKSYNDDLFSGRSSGNFGNFSKSYGNSSRNYGNSSGSYGNSSRNYGNSSRNYGNSSGSYGNSSRNYGNTEKSRESSAYGLSVGGRKSKTGGYFDSYNDEFVYDSWTKDAVEHNAKSSRSNFMQDGQTFNKSKDLMEARKSGARFIDYGGDFGRNNLTKNVSGYGAKRSGKDSRPGFTKYGSDRGSFSRHGQNGNGSEHSGRKARLVNAEHRHNDFKQILDALKDETYLAEDGNF